VVANNFNDTHTAIDSDLYRFHPEALTGAPPSALTWLQVRGHTL